MAVSIVRELKQVDIVEADEMSNSTRSWLMFDPLAAEAAFPSTPLSSSFFLQCVLTDSGLLCRSSTDSAGNAETFHDRSTYIMFLQSRIRGIRRILTLE
jgi:hypothetical protein